MVMRCKEDQYDKNNITYKSEVNYSQSYSLFQCSFTCQIFMGGYPSPPKYMYKNYPPLCARLMSQFYFLNKMYHLCTMELFYNDIYPIFYLTNIYSYMDV